MDRATALEPRLRAEGWGEIEDCVAATELPPVPPSSDPERLLRYVLQIQPKYTEMEMMATHLRLYATSLEQDLEQARNHSRILSSEVENEREKKQFLERYAAQIVKERNELLHMRSTKKSKTSASSHFTWHACCKKSGEHVADIMPSMAAFRGDKLQEAMGLMRSLQDEVRNQERLRQEVNFMLKRTHREHDSKTTADRKHIQQLEKQLVQRSMLQSTTERKLYEVESALARYDNVKLHEISAIEKQLEEANARVSALESQCERYQLHQRDLEAERDDLQGRLTHVMLLKDELADQVDQLTTELHRAQADIESLRGEIEVLQSEDVTSLKTFFEGKVGKLQEEWSTREHELMAQVDTLRQELRKNELLLQRAATFVEEQGEKLSNCSAQLSRGQSHNSWSRQRDEWLRGSSASARRPEEEHVGSSLSRSQLSQSMYSVDSGDDLLVVKQDESIRDDCSLPHEVSNGLENAVDDFAPMQYFCKHQSLGQDQLEMSRAFSRSSQSSTQDKIESTSSGDAEQSSSFSLRPSPMAQSPLDNEDVEHKSDTSEDPATDLLADMQAMLKQFQKRRIQEERKAQNAEKALENYRHDRDEFRNMLAPIA